MQPESPNSLLEGNSPDLVVMQGRALGVSQTPTLLYSRVPTPHLIARLHRQERPPPEDLPGGSHQASAAQQWGGTRHPQDEQQHRIDGGRPWT